MRLPFCVFRRGFADLAFYGSGRFNAVIDRAEIAIGFDCVVCLQEPVNRSLRLRRPSDQAEASRRAGILECLRGQSQ